MSIICKYCSGSKNVKNGFVHGKQRYKCKECNRTFREGDDRENYSEEFRMEAIQWYLEGAGIRTIERRMKVSNVLVLKWIRKFASIVKEKIKIASDNIETTKDIQILEIDELTTIVKKRK